MIESFRDARLRRFLAGGSISLLGAFLLGIPMFDIWDDATNLSWAVLVTLAENALFLFLAAILVWGGLWLVRTDWEVDRVATVARRTVVATVAFGGLIGWATFLQIQVMGTLKPLVLALDGVLVGAVTSFGISVASTRATVFKREADAERARNDDLELLYHTASNLEATSDREAAYDIVEGALRDALDGSPFRVVVDGSTVVTHATPTDDAVQPVERVSIGGRGRIDLWDAPVEHRDILSVELFASHLDEAIQRIEREERLREERDILDFVNRTLRHDLLGDLSLLEARLRMLDRDVTFDEGAHAEHLDVALGRTDEMHEFIRTMRTYMESVLTDDHPLEAVPLCPVLDDHLDALRDAHPDVSITRESIPKVAVEADDLLGHVFANLLRNAVEHNDAPTPSVTVDAERLDDVVRVRIADNGPGIPDDRRETIFEQGSHGTESQGSGFGLYLVKDAVENYDGEVRVRDNEPRGTVFELDLPIAR
ncbi:sensor histidine kinase [Haloplanus aerogenes]|uniref:histidine kinase n=1 Tax=Haloplanus aerogenes TaxID=660522 RepID=A0A3M0DB81_9EURY|nr:ATP-binding protein [Haloplanus aerogenes]AZH26075.1 GHKL domain-containing protein [Haloplanus aerogenes]RMB18475.1 signal transduction histidine kinase [Haloplanus aerogenes]